MHLGYSNTWLIALHLVAVISWMAGMLYIWRLYVYHAMATENAVRETFQVMERKLLTYITTPAMIVSLITGVVMLVMSPLLMKQPWMHIKLTLLIGMFASHGMASAYRKKLLANPTVKSDKFFRVMNEVPTVLMILIVIAVVVKPFSRAVGVD
ncbi:MAG: protoporphyrinogen oxidase HemJ [Candidatus Sericytochromatia bacterium]